jgi:hypothetical protein
LSAITISRVEVTRHDEAGRDALPRHVADADEETPVHGDEVVVVAADLLGGVHPAVEVEAGYAWRPAREELLLDVARDLELLLHALLLLHLADEPRVLDRDGRLVGEGGEEVGVPVREGADVRVVEVDGAEDLLLDLEGHAEDRAEVEADDRRVAAVARVGGGVRREDGLARVDDLAADLRRDEVGGADVERLARHVARDLDPHVALVDEDQEAALGRHELDRRVDDRLEELAEVVLLVEPLVDLEQLPQVIALVGEHGDLGLALLRDGLTARSDGDHRPRGDALGRRRRLARRDGRLVRQLDLVARRHLVDRRDERRPVLGVARLGALLVEREEEDRRADLDPVAVAELVREDPLAVHAGAVRRVAVGEDEVPVRAPLDHAVAPRHVGVGHFEHVVHGAAERHDRFAKRNGSRGHPVAVDRHDRHYVRTQRTPAGGACSTPRWRGGLAAHLPEVERPRTDIRLRSVGRPRIRWMADDSTPCPPSIRSGHGPS